MALQVSVISTCELLADRQIDHSCVIAGPSLETPAQQSLSKHWMSEQRAMREENFMNTPPPGSLLSSPGGLLKEALP